MTMNNPLRNIWLVTAVVALAIDPPHAARAADRPPNIVLINADDLGYGDLGCYGNTPSITPRIDQLAREGMRFTDFYVAQAVCSASRAALLTGSYPNRIGILAALGPNAEIGIHPGETTLAELLKPLGYATAIQGKWHLGHLDPFLPTRHGFDAWFGLPYSNDMWPRHPSEKRFPDLPLMEGTSIIARNPDQRKLTRWYRERAVDFINRNHDLPFFLYFAHAMPHVPLHVSPPFENLTGRGLYADVIAEIDASVGAVLDTLERHSLTHKTLVIFTSDNGPWLAYGNHAGSSGGLREGKGTTFEGGVRVPCVVRWPGVIPPGSVCREPTMTIDWLPTIADIVGGAPPPHIDGLSILPLLRNDAGARSPHDALIFWWNRELQAVRAGHWKLHFPHDYVQVKGPPGFGGLPGIVGTARIELSLFNLTDDPNETKNLAGEHPEIVAQLVQHADAARTRLGDSAHDVQGLDVRPPGQVQSTPETPKP